MNSNNELSSNRLHQAINKAYESTLDTDVTKEIVDKIIELEISYQFSDDFENRKTSIFHLLDEIIG